MGLGIIPPRTDPTVINGTWFNVLKDALCSHVVPRNANGEPEANAGSLGDGAHRWLKLCRASGGPYLGQIIWVYDYNGIVEVPEGFMLCNGRFIIDTEYNAEHPGSGWAKYVGSTPLEWRRLPNLIGRYFSSNSLNQTVPGETASIPSVGSNALMLEHAHHSAGTNPAPPNAGNNGQDPVPMGVPPGHVHTVNILTALDGGNVNIQPESLAARPYMRII